MNYLQNHIWCSDSNWGGEYDCRHTVFFSRYGKSDNEDWVAIVDEDADKLFDKDRFDSMVKMLTNKGREFDPEDFRENYNQSVPNFKPEVLQWLHDNVKDKPKVDSDGHIKGWCIGSVEYRTHPRTGISVFFHRRKDAMAFIKRWSKWKKPVHYCQYFTDVRKNLNLETLKYELV